MISITHHHHRRRKVWISGWCIAYLPGVIFSLSLCCYISSWDLSFLIFLPFFGPALLSTVIHSLQNKAPLRVTFVIARVSDFDNFVLRERCLLDNDVGNQGTCHLQPNGDDTSGEILRLRNSLVLRLRPWVRILFIYIYALHIMQGIDNDNDGRLKELVSVLRGAKEGFLTRGGTQSSHLWSKKEVSSWKNFCCHCTLLEIPRPDVLNRNLIFWIHRKTGQYWSMKWFQIMIS